MKCISEIQGCILPWQFLFEISQSLSQDQVSSAIVLTKSFLSIRGTKKLCNLDTWWLSKKMTSLRYSLWIFRSQDQPEIPVHKIFKWSFQEYFVQISSTIRFNWSLPTLVKTLCPLISLCCYIFWFLYSGFMTSSKRFFFLFNEFFLRKNCLAALSTNINKAFLVSP